MSTRACNPLPRSDVYVQTRTRAALARHTDVMTAHRTSLEDWPATRTATRSTPRRQTFVRSHPNEFVRVTSETGYDDDD